MPWRHVKSMFALALTMSLVVHASILLLVGISMARSQEQVAMQRSDPVMLTLPPELQLGIDAPTPPSDTWLGFEKPEPQFAPPSIIDQAAFTEDPIAASPPPAEASTSTPLPADQAHPVETVLAQMPPLDSLPTSTPEPEQTPGQDETQPAETGASSEITLASFTRWLESLGFETAPDTEAAVEPRKNESPTPPSKPAPATDPLPPQTAAANTPVEIAIAPHPVSGAPNEGAKSDKDSAASSIIEVPRDQWQKGKPVAAHGLELKPQRPEFTVLMMLTAAPGNPLCLIKFGRDGVPVKAELVESSGDSRVDEAIKASLYRWRAAGKELGRLAKDETADVTMRIILTRSRRS